MRAFADEFVDLDIEASAQAGGALGFAGTLLNETAPAAGLIRLADDSFGGGPKVPMVPKTWEPQAKPPDEAA
jgi:hypothetical protein